MWAVIFVLSNGAAVALDLPVEAQQKYSHCLEYGSAIAQAINATSAGLKIVSTQCWRRA